ncbi:hypothetical protein DIPPA_23641 [Diplonema papillatum]|nr:hypothetical protein DIPPA_23641 [Diplonema papillatum]
MERRGSGDGRRRSSVLPPVHNIRFPKEDAAVAEAPAKVKSKRRSSARARRKSKAEQLHRPRAASALPPIPSELLLLRLIDVFPAKVGRHGDSLPIESDRDWQLTGADLKMGERPHYANLLAHLCAALESWDSYCAIRDNLTTNRPLTEVQKVRFDAELRRFHERQQRPLSGDVAIETESPRAATEQEREEIERWKARWQAWAGSCSRVGGYEAGNAAPLSPADTVTGGLSDGGSSQSTMRSELGSSPHAIHRRSTQLPSDVSSVSTLALPACYQGRSVDAVSPSRTVSTCSSPGIRKATPAPLQPPCSETDGTPVSTRAQASRRAPSDIRSPDFQRLPSLALSTTSTTSDGMKAGATSGRTLETSFAARLAGSAEPAEHSGKQSPSAPSLQKEAHRPATSKLPPIFPPQPGDHLRESDPHPLPSQRRATPLMRVESEQDRNAPLAPKAPPAKGDGQHSVLDSEASSGSVRDSDERSSSYSSGGDGWQAKHTAPRRYPRGKWRRAARARGLKKPPASGAAGPTPPESPCAPREAAEDADQPPPPPCTREARPRRRRRFLDGDRRSQRLPFSVQDSDSPCPPVVADTRPPASVPWQAVLPRAEDARVADSSSPSLQGRLSGVRDTCRADSSSSLQGRIPGGVDHSKGSQITVRDTCRTDSSSSLQSRIPGGVDHKGSQVTVRDTCRTDSSSSLQGRISGGADHKGNQVTDRNATCRTDSSSSLQDRIFGGADNKGSQVTVRDHCRTDSSSSLAAAGRQRLLGSFDAAPTGPFEALGARPAASPSPRQAARSKAAAAQQPPGKPAASAGVAADAPPPPQPCAGRPSLCDGGFPVFPTGAPARRPTPPVDQTTPAPDEEAGLTFRNLGAIGTPAGSGKGEPHADAGRVLRKEASDLAGSSLSSQPDVRTVGLCGRKGSRTKIAQQADDTGLDAATLTEELTALTSEEPTAGKRTVDFAVDKNAILGSGAHGTVYKGYINGNVQVAVKRVSVSRQGVLLLKRELGIWRKLSRGGGCEHVVRYFGHMLNNKGEMSVAMEYCRYGSLLDLLNRGQLCGQMLRTGGFVRNETAGADQSFWSGIIDEGTGEVRREKLDEMYNATSCLASEDGSLQTSSRFSSRPGSVTGKGGVVRGTESPTSPSLGSAASPVVFSNIDAVLTKPGLPLAAVFSFVSHILRGLKFLHDHKVIHRDIKPSNVLLCDTGVIKLCDFGVSTIVETDCGAHTVVGTPGYLSPEVVQQQPYGTASDVWSLGCCLLELVTGVRPYSTFISATAVIKTVSDPHPPIPPSVPPAMRGFLMSTFSKVPEARPTAQELLESPLIAPFAAASVFS